MMLCMYIHHISPSSIVGLLPLQKAGSLAIYQPLIAYTYTQHHLVPPKKIEK